MKKKKAFTLVELLAVIVILAIILLIAVPNVLKIIENSKNNSFDRTVELIENTSKKYVAANMDNLIFDENNKTKITLEQMINDKYFNEVLDPRCGKELDKILTYVTVTKINNTQFNYETTVKSLCGDNTPSTYKESILNGTDPVLSNNMIPVIYKDNTWKVADTYSKWYSYTDKDWANVVTVTEGSRSKYLNGDGTYKKDIEVLEGDVLTYLVWIPRYKYKLFNVEALQVPEQMIEVVFENNKTSKSNGSNNGEYLTHPAFSWDRNSDGSYSADEELNGIWVGKFETTGSTTSPTVKPNLPAVAKVNIKALFDMSLKFSENNNSYGLETLNDSHMMKNTEWGSATYLTYSKYGRYNFDGSCIESGCEVWINNVYVGDGKNYYSITGCVEESVSASQVTVANDLCPSGYEYNSTTGPKASTTGNIYGIYDMSGGHVDYVMGNMKDINGNFHPSSTGFSEAPARKYYDLYDNGSTKNDQAAYDRRILGDATGEVRRWYGDYPNFVGSSYSWFLRGGRSFTSTGAGLSYFNITNGAIVNDCTSRLVVTPNK